MESEKSTKKTAETYILYRSNVANARKAVRDIVEIVNV